MVFSGKCALLRKLISQATSYPGISSPTEGKHEKEAQDLIGQGELFSLLIGHGLIDSNIYISFGLRGL